MEEETDDIVHEAPKERPMPKSSEAARELAPRSAGAKPNEPPDDQEQAPDDGEDALLRPDDGVARERADSIDLSEVLRILTRYVRHRVPSHGVDELVDEILFQTVRTWIRGRGRGNVVALGVCVTG